MKRCIFVFFGLCLFLNPSLFAEDMDKELQKLAEKLASTIKEQGKKKVTVLDFTDLQGGGTELGRYVAEELTIDLVMAKRDFSVLDRANLKKIMAEHKLTATGLVDPENAKKLGQFAGVDTLVLGTLVPKGTNSFTATAKLITVDTAEIVGAVRCEFKTDDQVQKLAEKSSTGVAQTDKAQVTKPIGDLAVDFNTVNIVDGTYYVLEPVS